MIALAFISSFAFNCALLLSAFGLLCAFFVFADIVARYVTSAYNSTVSGERRTRKLAARNFSGRRQQTTVRPVNYNARKQPTRRRA